MNAVYQRVSHNIPLRKSVLSRVQTTKREKQEQKTMSARSISAREEFTKSQKAAYDKSRYEQRKVSVSFRKNETWERSTFPHICLLSFPVQ